MSCMLKKDISNGTVNDVVSSKGLLERISGQCSTLTRYSVGNHMPDGKSPRPQEKGGRYNGRSRRGRP